MSPNFVILIKNNLLQLKFNQIKLNFSEANYWHWTKGEFDSEGGRRRQFSLPSSRGSSSTETSLEKEGWKDAIRSRMLISISWCWTFIAINLSGALEMAGGDIVLGSVTRHQAGAYQCVTRDDYGLEPVTKEVNLFVECKSYQFYRWKIWPRKVRVHSVVVHRVSIINYAVQCTLDFHLVLVRSFSSCPVTKILITLWKYLVPSEPNTCCIR